MYILFLEGYIQRYSPDTEVFFRPRQKNIPRAGPCPRAEGPRARSCPRDIFLPRTKKNRGGGGYIVVYGLTKIIYIINIPLLFQLSKQLFNALVISNKRFVGDFPNIEPDNHQKKHLNKHPI